MQIPDLYKIFLQFPSIQTDTRKLQPNDLYFALKGANFNGNLFAKNALEAGAAFAIVDEAPGFESEKIIKVGDVLNTMQLLAKYHRQQFNIPFVAITGSNGKTTTKELIHQVLSMKFKTYTTEGNLNNHIGIPLTILKIKSDAEMAIIEMGANHQKEIESYCQFTLPTHGLITNCGKAHLEGFGGIEGVRKGKGELFDYLRAHGGEAFIFNDYDYLIEMSHNIKSVFSYGTKNADIVGNSVGDSGFLEVEIKNGATIPLIKTHLVGQYNLPNVLAAVALGKFFKVEDKNIKDALENYLPSNSRSQLIEKDGNKIILDAYNANPTSMKAAIENFASLTGDEKILMLGGMMELGSESLKEHEGIINLIKNYSWKAVALVGGEYEKINHSYHNFKNVDDAKKWFDDQQFSHYQMLLKGSRSMQMEKILG